MSAQVQSYRWSDKPVAAKQVIAGALILLLIGVLVLRFRAKFISSSEVHAFTQAKQEHSKSQTEQDIKTSGSVAAGGINKAAHLPARGSARPPSQHQNSIQERQLFDGMTATLEVTIDQSISTSSGDSSVDATVVVILPGDVSSSDAEGIANAKLHGQFQANFETKRMQIQFRELTMPDGRKYAVSGFATDLDGQGVGVPADYSSGMGLRILGATLGTVISTAEIVATSRVIENGAGQDALMASQLNQAITTSSQGATATISDEATRELKNEKAVLSLPAGTHFRVKIRPTAQTQTGGST
jgi:hypothetical protein